MNLSNKLIAIIDYEMGNIGSIVGALKFLEIDFIISKNINKLSNAHAYILPGVGAFPQGMKNIKRFKLDKLINREVEINKKHFLGICLGMQLLADYSIENKATQGLGLINGKVVNMKNNYKTRIPHVGWNNIKFKKDNKLFRNITSNSNFYFDHSFKFVPKNNNSTKATTKYSETFTSIVNKGNIYGTQFHPEKSQRNGLKILRNFSNLVNLNE